MKTNMKHQDAALVASKGRQFFAYFMDPGTGKTRVDLLDGYREFERGNLDAMLILAPNNVKTGWVAWDHMLEPGEMDQVTDHLGDKLEHITKGVWVSSAYGQDKKCWAEFEKAINSKKRGKFIVLSVNYEALLSEQFFEFLKAFCQTFRTMIVADESTRIGEPGSKRTKRAITLRKLCVSRRILTGTPIVKKPMKIYSQAKFLDDNALPFKSFYSFRNHFANMGGFQGRQVMSYKNLDYLTKLIEGWSFRARKKDCLDLPPQIYLKRRVYHTPEQAKAYKTMREEFFAKFGTDEITAPIVLAQMTRLQQINGGYVTTKDGDVVEIIPPDKNPKLLETLELIDNAPGQVVAWFRFREEIEGMKKLIALENAARKKNIERGDQVTFLEFHGGVPQKDRMGIRGAFKRGDAQVLLGTESTGGIGINEFLVADTVIHVSYDFDTEKRVQADDRNHRIGSEIHEKITYYDILIPNTIDTKILRVLKTDQELSAKILKDNWRELI